MSLLLDRLTSQLSQRMGYDKARKMAKGILIKRGQMNSDGSDTSSGMIRGMMTPEQRAVDRAVKRFGGTYKDYEYSYDKNYAYKKKKKV